jgi:hypothetical protein
MGIIVKPLPFWRIGASITTPSAYFKLQENNNSAMTSVIDGTAQTYTFASDTFSVQHLPFQLFKTTESYIWNKLYNQ